MEKSIPYKNYLFDYLKEPQGAAAYLNAALEEGNEAFTLALKDVVKILGGGVTTVAHRTELNRESLYRMLSDKGNPQLKSLNAVIDSLGLQLHIMPRSLTEVQSRNLG